MAVERATSPWSAAPMADDRMVDAYERYFPSMVRRLSRRTRDPEASADIAHEAFVRLLSETREGRAPREVGGWLWRVATNLVASGGRHTAAGRRWQARLAPDDPGLSPEDLMITRERDDLLRRAVDGLPPDARRSLMLAAQGFSGREIASAIRRSEGATRSLMCRSRARVREELGSRS